MTVTTIDAKYLGHEEFVSTYLLQQGDRAAFIETANAPAVPRMLEVLAARGMSPEQVDYVIITHVHLDHAGGAADLMKACPNATLLAHPNAAKHAIDPSKLVRSAKGVYGEVLFAEMYGTIDPIAEHRVRIMGDNEALNWNGRELRFLHTRGHANHHFCVHDPAEGGVFTGDAFGLVYPRLQGKGLFAVPSTSPTDFDAAAAKASIDRIVAIGAETAYLTHCGGVTELSAVAALLHPRLDRYGVIVEEAFASDRDDAGIDVYCREQVDALFSELLEAHGLESAETRKLLTMDMDLNGQGIAFAVKKRRFKAGRVGRS
ncbi:MAG: MBL fold metallo-hydrolase [Nannocystaceae bacterium]|nr:MBL fold metallo-hydrolase [Nannocystaceae bacterium]